MARESSPGTSGTSRWTPSRTTSRPPITTVRTSAAQAPNTAASSAAPSAAPAVRTLSNDTVTRSAHSPGAISPASGQPRLVCPSQVAARNSASAVKCPRERRASRSAYSTPRASSRMSTTAWLSLPRVSVQPAAASACDGARPSPRSRSVVGQMQANTPQPPSRFRSPASTWVACTTEVRGPGGPPHGIAVAEPELRPGQRQHSTPPRLGPGRRRQAAGQVAGVEQRHPQAGLGRRLDQGAAHRVRVRVRPPVRLVMQVVELADAAHPGQRHLGVHGAGQPEVAVGVEAGRDGVHALAPGPERAVVRLGSGPQRAVERVRVGVGEPGQGEARARTPASQSARSACSAGECETPVGLRTNSMAVGTRAASTPASCPAPVGRTGAGIPAAASTPAIRSRSPWSKRTAGVYDSCRTLRVTTCSWQNLVEAERTAVTVFSNVASSGALASSQALTADGTPLAPPGSAIILPNVASAPLQAAVWRAARTVLA